jgi:hypothetical protein
MSRKLPAELKRLRRDMRLCYGRGRYYEAHQYADTLYAYRLEERRTSRRRKKVQP